MAADTRRKRANMETRTRRVTLWREGSGHLCNNNDTANIGFKQKKILSEFDHTSPFIFVCKFDGRFVYYMIIFFDNMAVGNQKES